MKKKALKRRRQKIDADLTERMDKLMEKENADKKAIDKDAADKAAKIQKQARDKAEAEAKITISHERKKITDESQVKVNEEKRVQKEDLEPLRQSVSKLEKKFKCTKLKL